MPRISEITQKSTIAKKREKKKKRKKILKKKNRKMRNMAIIFTSLKKLSKGEKKEI